MWHTQDTISTMFDSRQNVQHEILLLCSRIYVHEIRDFEPVYVNVEMDSTTYYTGNPLNLHAQQPSMPTDRRLKQSQIVCKYTENFIIVISSNDSNVTIDQ